MAKTVHLIGNGKSAGMFLKGEKKGLKVACNIPPFAIPGLYTSVLVDFKMMKAIDDGVIEVPGDWTLGARPKKYMEMRAPFYMKHAHQIKEFYTVLPKYVPNYTDFNCGHMATHYIMNKLKAEEIHMYGFDSIFAFDITSSSDSYMKSSRDNLNTERLTSRWRPIWKGMFNEFKDRKFVLYSTSASGHSHVPLPDNVEVVLNKKGKK
jgi:hypothetical protein